MNPDPFDGPNGNAPRKVRFKPKGPPKKEKIVLPKSEKFEVDVDEAKAEHLLRRFNETSLKARTKAERKVEPSQVAFGVGASRTLKSYGSAKAKNDVLSSDGVNRIGGKEYKEPFDYYTDYPSTLPLRRPYSGNPDILNEEEFGDFLNKEELGGDPLGSESVEDDINTAQELGLMDEGAENNMFLFQLPTMLPAIPQSSEPENNKTSKNHPKLCKMESLPEGHIGKMLVYKSGAVKMNLGGILYDVSPGVKCNFAQDVVAINAAKKHCCNMGEVNKRAVVTPDIDSMLQKMEDL